MVYIFLLVLDSPVSPGPEVSSGSVLPTFADDIEGYGKNILPAVTEFELLGLNLNVHNW